MSNASSFVRGGTGSNIRVSEKKRIAFASEMEKVLVESRRTPLSLQAVIKRQSSSVKTLVGNRRGRSSRTIRAFAPSCSQTCLYHSLRFVPGEIAVKYAHDWRSRSRAASGLRSRKRN